MLNLNKSKSIGFRNVRLPLARRLALAFLAVIGAQAAFAADAPIVITGPEQKQLDLTKVDGGIPHANNVRNVEVFHASKEQPETSDGKGWTYHHHPDLAEWKGRLYVGWDSCEVDEDVWPSRELYSWSDDGVKWSKPAEMFPMGVSTPLRTYFFHSPNGKMIAIAGLRLDHSDTDEHTKGSLVMREIQGDHSLGPVYTLRKTADVPGDLKIPAIYTESSDKDLITAAQQLLANHTFLEQQDYGRLLDESDRMAWHNPENWHKPNADKLANSFGKAFSFFHRKDGAMVGICKRGWTVLSTDEGKTWSFPVHPPTLVTGNAKVWGQKTADGKYALVYNPDPTNRFPLVIVTGDDGITFGNMRVIYGEHTPQRYTGRSKNLGPQYVRGLGEWASDGSRKEDAMWIVYSVNKEDIWVSRIDVPAGK